MHGFTKAPRRKFQERCLTCNDPFASNPIGRRKKYCSARCRKAAFRSTSQHFATAMDDGSKTKIKTLYAPLIQNTERNDVKSPCAARSDKTKKKTLGRGVVGPRCVIEAEINGALTWTTITSSDGVRSLVAQLRPSTLVEADDVRAARRPQKEYAE
jgi:hypothetical protein